MASVGKLLAGACSLTGKVTGPLISSGVSALLLEVAKTGSIATGCAAVGLSGGTATPALVVVALLGGPALFKAIADSRKEQEIAQRLKRAEISIHTFEQTVREIHTAVSESGVRVAVLDQMEIAAFARTLSSQDLAYLPESVAKRIMATLGAAGITDLRRWNSIEAHVEQTWERTALIWDLQQKEATWVRQALEQLQASAEYQVGRLDQILAVLKANSINGPVVKVRNNFADAQVVWNRLFTGRETEIARLSGAISATPHSVCHAITGGGGVGKTELARAFAIIFAAEYDGVWWIDASSEGLASSVARLFTIVFEKTAPRDAQLEILLGQLCSYWSNGRHLIILDNLESPEYLLLFSPGLNSRIIATTRSDLSASAIADTFPIDTLTEDSSVDLLKKQTAKRASPCAESALRSIAKELGCHALAVALAGAYLARYLDVNAEEYLARLRASGVGEVSPRQDGAENDPLSLRYKHGVRACLTLYFGRFAEGNEIRLLAVASFFYSNGIPIKVLAATTQMDVESARSLARNLADLSILQFEAAVSVHRLTQSVVRSLLEDADKAIIINNIAVVLLHMFKNFVDPAAWRVQSEVVVHASAVLEHAAAMPANLHVAVLGNQVGLYFETMGRYSEALRVYRKVLEWLSQLRGPGDPLVARTLTNLCAVQIKLGDLVGARSSAEKALAIDSARLSPNHPTFAIRYSSLAEVCRQERNLKKAKEYLELAIGIDEMNVPGDRHARADRYSNMATLLKDIGDFKSGRAAIGRALAIDREHLDEDHPAFATRYNNLARICMEEGDERGAMDNFRAAEQILKKHFEDDHPNVLSVQRAMQEMRSKGWT